MALEAIEALLSLGLKESDIMGFIQQSCKVPQPQWYVCSALNNDWLPVK